LFFCGSFFGDVARDLGESEQISGAVANGVEDDIGEKGTAVFPNAPSFGFIFSGSLGGRECDLWRSILAVFLDVEA